MIFTPNAARSKIRPSLTLFACVFLSSQLAPAQENWPRFRGADATGVVPDDARLPDSWDRERNVRWRTNIPGWGWGSPIVWGNRVFVSAVNNKDEYERPRAGFNRQPKGPDEPPKTVHHWMVYCLSLETGDIIWKHEAHSGVPKVPRHLKSTYASETPTTDGKRLYVLFGDLGLYCYDFDGNPLWQHAIEPKKTLANYGAAASPVVLGEQVIMVYDNEEASYIASIDGATGRTWWKQTRDEVSTWSTPFVWTHPGRTEIVTTGFKANRGYAPNGELLWHFDGRMTAICTPSPFAVDGLLYITSGSGGGGVRPMFAIRPGAVGDITLKTTLSQMISFSGRSQKWVRITFRPSFTVDYATYLMGPRWAVSTLKRESWFSENVFLVFLLVERASWLRRGPTTEKCSA
jgi:outer membrane protein assembly factor BamB